MLVNLVMVLGWIYLFKLLVQLLVLCRFLFVAAYRHRGPIGVVLLFVLLLLLLPIFDLLLSVRYYRSQYQDLEALVQGEIS